MPLILNCCDILISHFNFHGKWPHNCSIKHLEYLSVGKPTVATDVGEVNFAIEHGVNGQLAPYGDKEQLANHLHQILSDDEFSSSLAQRARQYVYDRFSGQRMADEYIDLYKIMLGYRDADAA